MSLEMKALNVRFEDDVPTQVRLERVGKAQADFGEGLVDVERRADVYLQDDQVTDRIKATLAAAVLAIQDAQP